MYVEVPQNLADFDDYVPFSPVTATDAGNSTASSPAGDSPAPATWSWAGYRSRNNALCDADRKFVRPSVAQDITGRWFVIVQSSMYHQQIPTELCRSDSCTRLTVRSPVYLFRQEPWRHVQQRDRVRSECSLRPEVPHAVARVDRPGQGKRLSIHATVSLPFGLRV